MKKISKIHLPFYLAIGLFLLLVLAKFKEGLNAGKGQTCSSFGTKDLCYGNDPAQT